MKKKPLKQRNRPEGKISRLADEDLLSAFEIASFGKQLSSNLERAMVFYAKNLQKLKLLESKAISTLRARHYKFPLDVEREAVECKTGNEHVKTYLTNFFLDAVKSLDVEKLEEIVKAVRCTKKIIGGLFFVSRFDPIRHYVLVAKLSLGKSREGKTLRELAKGFYPPKDFKIKEINKFSEMRKICDSMKYPYKRLRKSKLQK